MKTITTAMTKSSLYIALVMDEESQLGRTNSRFDSLREAHGCEKHLRVTLKRIDAGDKRSATSVANDNDNDNRKKYRRQNCGICKGCLTLDCRECKFCLDKFENGGGGKRRQKCARRRCHAPTLPKNARCVICNRRTSPSYRDISFPHSHLELAECGLECATVVHPACMIVEYGFDTNVECKFYSKLLNAWDCLLCLNGVAMDKTPLGRRSMNDDDDDETSFASRLLFKSPCKSGSKLGIETELSSSRNDAKITTTTTTTTTTLACQVCGECNLAEYLMTCTRCAQVQHDVCLYAKHRKDPRFVAGIRDCVDPKFWECPLCLLRRGVRAENWTTKGIFADARETTTTTHIKERIQTMFNPQIGNIDVSHFSILIHSPPFESVVSSSSSNPPTTHPLSPPLPPPSEEEFLFSMDLKDFFSEQEIDEEQSEVVSSFSPGNIETCVVSSLKPNSTGKCDLCSSSFDGPTSETLLAEHRLSQHPKCGHCEYQEVDMPKILNHFKTRHNNLKRCKVLIANETLTLAMNSSFHG